jgi:hypothetical protein
MISTTIPYEYNDGGFKDSGIQDTNNCTIVAFAIVTGMEYSTADQIGVKTKRVRRRGHWPEKMVNYSKRVYGLRFRKFKFASITLQKFLKKYPTGRYYVANKDHCFAIIDGVVQDHAMLVRPFQIIKNAWQII